MVMIYLPMSLHLRRRVMLLLLHLVVAEGRSPYGWGHGLEMIFPHLTHRTFPVHYSSAISDEDG